MTDRKIPVTDKRGSLLPPDAAPDDEQTQSSSSAEEEQRDYLADLQRVQAEFENYRKRMMKEQTALTERVTGQFIARLLPVLDDFERAIAHGEGGEGVALVFKSLRDALEAEGLVEIEAVEKPFDPTIHEAVQSHEADVEVPTVESVFRRGYMVRERVVRPAMVVVARPREADETEEVTADGSA